jgi:tRNA A-37 threonylcarbamoyl transferase component Bud32
MVSVERASSHSRAASPLSGRYQVEQALAEGGMGTVYRCYDRLRQKEVAYKRLRVANEATRARQTTLFQREFDTLARLSHPNIVEVYDYGLDAHGPYYTMELLTGADLAELAPLSFQEGCRVLRDVASALSLLHARRLVHRDVTPANVRLTEERHAKLIDFGALTTVGKPAELVGTPLFVPPEALRGEPLDARADLYGLGALAYWTFTRRTHLRARTFEELESAWREPLLPPSAHCSGLARELDHLVLALLSPDRDARPGAAADVIERLTRLADLEPESDERRVAYSYLKHPPLVGRGALLSRVQDALRETMAGTGQILWFEAARGMGRTALLGQIGVEAQLQGASVLRADAGGARGAFGTARSLVGAGLQMLPGTSEAGSARTACERALDHFSVQHAPVEPRSAMDASERLMATSAALADALFALSEFNALVLLVDDVHLADGESMSLLAAAGEQLRARRVLTVLSAPEGAVQRDAMRAKLVLGAAHERLLPLSEADVFDMAKILFGDVPNTQRLAAWLHARTQGNPGQALDLTRVLLAKGGIHYTLGTFVIAHTFDDYAPAAESHLAQLARLAGVSSNAHAVMQLLALHDGPLGVEHLARAAALLPSATLLALGELGRRGAVRSQGESYVCELEALREAVRARFSEPEARRVHLGLAAALRTEPLSSLESRLAVARHLMLAGGAESVEGAFLMAQAGDTHRYESARMARHLPLFELALTILEREGLPDHECIGILMPLSLAGYYGHLEVQRRYLTRTLDALSDVCGLSLARRLSRTLGPKLGLFAGLTFAFLRHVLARRRLNTRTFAQNLAAFFGIAVVTTGVVACTYDAEETLRIANYCAPFEGAPKRSGLYCMREFCLATAELMDARVQSAQQRYAYVAAVFAKPVRGVDEVFRHQANLGCLNGSAYALSLDSRPEALAYAGELAERAAFYRPHAECAYVTYHANRGESAQAKEHRTLAEEGALRGGAAWSALCSLNQCELHAFALTGDVVGLLRVVAELERLSNVSTSIAALAALGRAHLEQLRGNLDDAIALYEELLPGEIVRRLPSYPVDAALYAQALSRVGRHEHAKAVCEPLLNAHHETPVAFLLPRQKLAIAEASLGNTARATALLSEALVCADARGNPLALGGVHRELAYVAALASDQQAYARHAEEMSRHYKATRNALLIQQCDALRAQASALGLVPNDAFPPSLADNDDYDGDTIDGTDLKRHDVSRTVA